MKLEDMPNGTSIWKYQDKQYQAFYQNNKGIRVFADASSPELALEKLSVKLLEIGIDK